MEENELLVPVFDYELGEFVVNPDGSVKTVSGSEAAGHVALKAESTERGVFAVYANYDDEDENHIFGSDVKAVGITTDLPEAARMEEVKRAAEEAIAYDPWVESVDEVTVTKGVDKNGKPCFIIDIEFTDIFAETVIVEGVEV